MSTHDTRQAAIRIFVNRSLRLEQIKMIGFDMDYTLIQYKSPETEFLAFNLAKERLVQIGYPEEVKSFEYKPFFPIRGVWFDYTYGNIVKTDGFGNIMKAFHGEHCLTPAQVSELYPNKYLQLSENRVFVLNTLFNLPEVHMLALLIDFFDNNPEFERLADRTGVKNGEMLMTYKQIFWDCRTTIDWVHIESSMKDEIMKNPDVYVHKDERAPIFLKQLKESGKRTFLLTNSDWPYTNVMMTYLIGENWRSYFDITVVDARKPKWFSEGTVFREVDPVTSAFKLGIHSGPFKPTGVYSGGSCDAFHKMVKCRGKDVLYIGDHIFGDVLRSKKSRGWKTFLVVPELDHELTVWTTGKPFFDQLNNLDVMLSEIYKNLDVSTKQKPQIESIVDKIKHLSRQMEEEYSCLGSLFRSGTRTTFFSSQVERYADIYASSCYNLVHYPSFYFFRATMQLMPHESTVDHSATMKSIRQQSYKRQESVGDQVREWSKKTANENEICHEDEEEDQSSGSHSDAENQRNPRLRDKSVSDESSEHLADTDVVSQIPALNDTTF
ncbi:hypothetical protein WR25_10143 [Diploscapter pachys]|uniref:Uncharacterized protein n=1 Tax=Diploscapter pachys TaxID=2018661 RepID=A0A2A2LET2_9BILA|nr:hypothetical protein WR25_10143 [Diploscapter pachys]